MNDGKSIVDDIVPNEPLDIEIIDHHVPDAPAIRVYNDFIDCKLLNMTEKMLFLTLKACIKDLEDNGSMIGICKISLNEIARMNGCSRKTVAKQLNTMQEKGSIKIGSTGKGFENYYILADKPEMWSCKTVEELKNITTKMYEEFEKQR